MFEGRKLAVSAAECSLVEEDRTAGRNAMARLIWTTTVHFPARNFDRCGCGDFSAAHAFVGVYDDIDVLKARMFGYELSLTSVGKW
jgi:hypothetical protein